MRKEIDNSDLILYNRVQDRLTEKITLFDTKYKNVEFNFKYELLKNMVDVKQAVQVRGYYSLDRDGSLDLTGSVNVLVYEMSVEEIILNMINTANYREQKFICPYVGLNYHEQICEIINDEISNIKKERNFPLL